MPRRARVTLVGGLFPALLLALCVQGLAETPQGDTAGTVDDRQAGQPYTITVKPDLPALPVGITAANTAAPAAADASHEQRGEARTAPTDSAPAEEEEAADEDETREIPWHWVLNENVRRVSAAGLALLMGSMLLLSAIDWRRTRRLERHPPLSVIIPCYNDGDTIGATVDSVFASVPHDLLDVIVINDASPDDSATEIGLLRQRHPIRVVANPVNRGKTPSLNDAAPEARHEIILFLDADTVLNKAAVTDMLARIAADRQVGAVSCPYRTKQGGFFPTMQGIEYSMLLLTQGAHNLTSAMAAWGGCLMVRRDAFMEVGRFSSDALTEDVDLAFKMNRLKWRVEQSFVAVESEVPDNLRAWVRQKRRWTAGGMQCYVRHVPVWIRNPSQICFIFAYSLLVLSSIPAMVSDFRFGGSVMNLFAVLNQMHSFWASLGGVFAFYGREFLRRMLGSGLCCLLSTVYILPQISRWREIWRLLLVFPFALVYFPAYIIVSLFGIVKGIRSVRHHRPADVKGW